MPPALESSGAMREGDDAIFANLKLFAFFVKDRSKSSSKNVLLRLKMVATAGDNQCEVVLVGCGAPSRGMGWYHAEQMLKGKCPSAKLCYIVEPWFLGAGTCL